MLTLPEQYIPLHPTVQSMLDSTFKLYVDGEFVDAQSGKTFTSVDPSTEQVLAHVAEGDAA
ncbi:MAG: betaine-aldehyde dehydrogenase, partial [Chloroflexota bacterium]